MADIQVNEWKRSKRMDKEAIIRFQILVQVHLNNISITSSDLDCLTLLRKNGTIGLHKFCGMVTDLKIFRSVQSTRNALMRLEHKGIICKTGSTMKKDVFLNPEYRIQNTGNILLDIKCISLAT